MDKIRVVVVEDSLTVRRRIGEVLGDAPDIEVIGEAEDGRRAIELCRELRPDVITLDMMLPLMSGLGATEYIMAHFPTPILIVSSSVNRGELFKTYDALAAGAVDVLEKPIATESDGEWAERLIAAVRIVARVRVITHPRARLASLQSRRAAISPIRKTKVIAIGASTGGPGAVVEVFRSLPSDLATPIILVLHISAMFAGAFVDWLDAQTEQRVEWAVPGIPLESVGGRVLMAPPEQHLIVRDGHLQFSNGPERNSCRPSIDVLFESIAREYGSQSCACVLTGMGKDGAQGLLEIRRAGGATLAQDEQTSVVYGMPAEAARIGAAERVLPLDGIGRALAAFAERLP